MENQTSQPLLNHNPYAQIEKQIDQAPLPDNQAQQTANDILQPNPGLESAKEPIMDDARLNRNSEFAEDLNRLKARQSSMHCQAIFATIVLLGGIGTGVILYISGTLSTEGMIGVLVGAYFLYLIIGCCCNRLNSYLGNIDKGENFELNYEYLRKGIGFFWFHAECYHYETRYHTRTYTDSNGNTQTQTYTTTEKVVTHTATENLTPTRTDDQSGAIDRIRAETSMVFIHFYLRYRFKDPQSQHNFDSFYANFKLRHHYDTHQTYTFGYKMAGMIERKAFFVGQLECDFNTWFYLCGMVGCLCPYSCWVQSKISRFDVDLMKVLTL